MVGRRVLQRALLLALVGGLVMTQSAMALFGAAPEHLVVVVAFAAAVQVTIYRRFQLPTPAALAVVPLLVDATIGPRVAVPLVVAGSLGIGFAVAFDGVVRGRRWLLVPALLADLLLVGLRHHVEHCGRLRPPEPAVSVVRPDSRRG